MYLNPFYAGLHWIFMTTWIFVQRTDFCTTWWEERLFNAVVGVIYCFCFFNLKEGRTRWRMLIFYTIMLLENGVLLGLWYPYRWQGAWYNDAVLAAVCTSTLIGRFPTYCGQASVENSNNRYLNSLAVLGHNRQDWLNTLKALKSLCQLVKCFSL